jgi:hypothetical protein
VLSSPSRASSGRSSAGTLDLALSSDHALPSRRDRYDAAADFRRRVDGIDVSAGPDSPQAQDVQTMDDGVRAEAGLVNDESRLSPEL